MRHQWRTGEAKAAIADAAETYVIAHAAQYVDPALRAHQLAMAIGYADIIGVGGRDGIEGIATTRIPALQGLGKGRKQASDGAAWSAAVECAMGDILIASGGNHWRFAPYGTSGDLAFGDIADTWAEDSDMTRLPEALVPRAWLRSIAYERLRRAAGLHPWHERVPMWTTLESLPMWAAAVNALSVSL